MCVCSTAVSSLSGKSKRRREEEQIIALGGKVNIIPASNIALSNLFVCVCVCVFQPAKNEKMPYPLYQKRVKAQKKKEKREKRNVSKQTDSYIH